MDSNFALSIFDYQLHSNYANIPIAPQSGKYFKRTYTGFGDAVENRELNKRSSFIDNMELADSLIEKNDSADNLATAENKTSKVQSYLSNSSTIQVIGESSKQGIDQLGKKMKFPARVTQNSRSTSWKQKGIPLDSIYFKRMKGAYITNKLNDDKKKYIEPEPNLDVQMGYAEAQRRMSRTTDHKAEVYNHNDKLHLDDRLLAINSKDMPFIERISAFEAKRVMNHNPEWDDDEYIDVHDQAHNDMIMKRRTDHFKFNHREMIEQLNENKNEGKTKTSLMEKFTLMFTCCQERTEEEKKNDPRKGAYKIAKYKKV